MARHGVKQTVWQFDHRDQNGKQRYKTFPTRKAVEAWSVTALHEVKQGMHTPACASITVSVGMELWISDGEANGLEFSTTSSAKSIRNCTSIPSSAATSWHH